MVQTVAQQILAALRTARGPMDDDQLVKSLNISPRQTFNCAARQPARQGVLYRTHGQDGKIVNVLTGTEPPVLHPQRIQPTVGVDELPTEDEVKERPRDHLVLDGWSVDVAWGRTRGVDIEARRESRRMLLEAKGQAVNPPQQVNYFLGDLGELVERIADPDAIYGLALPDHRQYRSLIQRMPPLFWERLHFIAFFASRNHVEQLPALKDVRP